MGSQYNNPKLDITKMAMTTQNNESILRQTSNTRSDFKLGLSRVTASMGGVIGAVNPSAGQVISSAASQMRGSASFAATGSYGGLNNMSVLSGGSIGTADAGLLGTPTGTGISDPTTAAAGGGAFGGAQALIDYGAKMNVQMIILQAQQQQESQQFTTLSNVLANKAATARTAIGNIKS
jgi:hypothetical protein